MSIEKLSYDPRWKTKYRDMIKSPEEAVKAIRPGSRIFVGTGCAQPQELVRALINRSSELTDTEIVHLLTIGAAPHALEELTQHFRINPFFTSEQEVLGDYTPVFLSDIPRLFHSGKIPLDVALIQVTPPNERGMCSLGISVDIVKSAAENATLVIAEVNPRMPQTLGNSLINVYDTDFLVPTETEILEYRQPEVDETAGKIGKYIAALIDDGSTVKFGIGRIPHSVVEFLKNKKDLGVHTEMFTDSIIDLVDSGVITGTRKSINREKIVASFCLGTRRLYDYIDNNPAFRFYPTEYVNDSHIISQQHKMVALGAALEVDLTGQVCSDSLGMRFFSGIGGQVDFNRGAARCAGGKAIIAMPSTACAGSTARGVYAGSSTPGAPSTSRASSAKDHTVSRIVLHLTPGAGVVSTRCDAHYVITEHGVAYLHGKSVQERALALISIAHPKFRNELLKAAVKAGYVRSELMEVGEKLQYDPPEMRTSLLLSDGTQVSFRPVHSTDEAGMRDLFYALSQETLYYRFMQHMKTVPGKQIRDFTYIDHRNDIAIVGTLPEAHGEDIIAIGRYYLDKTTNRAEVAFVVRDEWQRRGIGTLQFRDEF
jgi:acyl-CoA hydrolase